jgi:hypothetical protein
MICPLAAGRGLLKYSLDRHAKTQADEDRHHGSLINQRKTRGASGEKPGISGRRSGDLDRMELRV